ncbi:MAG: hypothetical protein JWO06_248 [Bacteroidota bacterium]|nr:hypothetical protein [Bacteroidota bacterium]
MIYGLMINEEAYEDLQRAYDYYEDERTGLGEEFLEKIEDRLDYLKKYPLHFNKVEDDFRQTLIDKFPFVIVYEIQRREIIVYSFFHCSQNPDKKFKK